MAGLVEEVDKGGVIGRRLPQRLPAQAKADRAVRRNRLLSQEHAAGDGQPAPKTSAGGGIFIHLKTRLVGQDVQRSGHVSQVGLFEADGVGFELPSQGLGHDRRGDRVALLGRVGQVPQARVPGAPTVEPIDDLALGRIGQHITGGRCALLGRAPGIRGGRVAHDQVSGAAIAGQVLGLGPVAALVEPEHALPGNAHRVGQFAPGDETGHTPGIDLPVYRRDQHVIGQPARPLVEEQDLTVDEGGQGDRAASGDYPGGLGAG